MVERVRSGKIDRSKIRAIAAILRNTNEAEIHRMRGGGHNVVYVSPDGHQEAVYDGNHNLVKDGINDGSYNYFHPQKDALRHFSFDIAPWLLFGQSEDDPTTRVERVHAYSADLYEGVMRTLAAPRTNDKRDDVDLKEPGCAEAVAILLLAMERGNAEEMVRVVSLPEKGSNRDLVPLVNKFEAGLREMIESNRVGRVTPE